MDGLRFLAVFMVLIEHFAYFIGNKIHAGFFGVDLFFVISGFLITEGLLNERGSEIKESLIRFYKKRFLRIFPIYYLMLFLAWFFSDSFKDVSVWAFTYTINYYPSVTGKEVPELFAHLWSLSVEEQFYIFWPFIVLLVPERSLPYFLGVIFFSSLAYFIIKSDVMGLPGRMYSLCFGAILAFLKKSYPAKFASNVPKRFMIIAFLSILVFLFKTSVGLSILSLGLVYLCSTSSYKGIFKKVLEQKNIAYWGKISYGIYLYHLPLAYLITVYLFDPAWNHINFDSWGGGN